MKTQLIINFINAKCIKLKNADSVVLDSGSFATVFVADNYSGCVFKMTAFDNVRDHLIRLSPKEGDAVAGIAEMSINEKNNSVQYKLLKFFPTGKVDPSMRSDFSLSFNNLEIDKKDIGKLTEITYKDDAGEMVTRKTVSFKLRYLGTNAKIQFKAYDYGKKMLASLISRQNYIEGDVLDGFANLHFEKKKGDGGAEKIVKTYIVQMFSYGSHNANSKDEGKNEQIKAIEKQEKLNATNPFSGTEIPAGKAFCAM